MKVVHFSDTAVLSGAGIAAARLVAALRDAGIEATLRVARGECPEKWIEPLQGRVGRGVHALRRVVTRATLGAAGRSDAEVLSGNFWPTGNHRRLSSTGSDIVHLHWVGAECLRVEEVPRIRPALVWTFHDEWWLLGLEHYAPTGMLARNRLFGYLDGSVRRRKMAATTRIPIDVICPSRWVARRVVEAFGSDALGMHVHVVPNTVPTDVFVPACRRAARLRMGLDPDVPVIGVGALQVRDDPRKGFQQLLDAFGQIVARRPPVLPNVLMFGADARQDLGLPIKSTGVIRDPEKLAEVYAAMDVFVCSSRSENLPNTIAESMSCGIPVVAFAVGGIPDLVEHGRTGYLANPFDVSHLATGILECLEPARNQSIGEGARSFAARALGSATIAARHKAVYELARSRTSAG